MSGVHVVSDSSCDLDQAEIDLLDIEIVPLSIRFGDNEYTDRLELSVEEFYERMATSDVLPRPRAHLPGSFERPSVRRWTPALMQWSASTSRALFRIHCSQPTAAASWRGASPFTSSPAHRCPADSAHSSLRRARWRVTEPMRRVSAPRRRSHTPHPGLCHAEHAGESEERRSNRGARAMVGSLLSIKPLIDISGGVVEEAGKARTGGVPSSCCTTA